MTANPIMWLKITFVIIITRWFTPTRVDSTRLPTGIGNARGVVSPPDRSPVGRGGDIEHRIMLSIKIEYKELNRMAHARK